MEPKERFEMLAAALEDAKAEFVLREVELARTFLDVADTTRDQSNAERNIEHARKAYEVAMRYFRDGMFAPTEQEKIRGKLAELGRRVREKSGGS
jgi:hypothetical protein